MNKRLTVITNYFPPESGAASNRIASMVDAFSKNGYEVTVICPLPSYPLGKIFESFRGKLFYKENQGTLTIYRLWHIPSNSSSKIKRLLSMFSFSFSLFWFLIFKRLSAVVFVQMSPIFVGFTSVLLLRLKRKKIILNVSDLWPLAGLEMGLLKQGLYYNILESIEKFCYKNSSLIMGQSEEILIHIKTLFQTKKIFLYRNLPPLHSELQKPVKKPSNETKIVYAGLLGVAQGVAGLIENLKLPEGTSISIYGEGPEAQKISQIAKTHPKIHYCGVLKKSKLDLELTEYDIALIPLVKRIYGSVPSKIFELSRLGVPVVYFSDGEGANIVETLGLGFVIKHHYRSEFEQLLNDLQQGKHLLPDAAKIKKTAKTHFDFNKQFQKLLKEIESY
ncbi:glycosyltransferase family 4 protein [uncultured Planktosalinus sp.]|uniref:glycosyltransferase family 4 protein n=1 Tax=uncultured Planktosalinus sp. TaxID=1810935 RepID=UPI0030D8FC27|tara:strand:- start:378 stop:1550 length:1173 start_codon:yes stop_codon:yes gene_type:complete